MLESTIYLNHNFKDLPFEHTLAMSKYFRLNIINRKFARLGSIISHVEKNVMCLELRQKRWRKNLQFILKCLA